MFCSKLHRIWPKFVFWLLSALHHTSVLVTFDKFEMFRRLISMKCLFTLEAILVYTFPDCGLSSLDKLASNRSTMYFTLSSVHHLYCCSLALFLVLLLVFFTGSGSTVNHACRSASSTTTAFWQRTATALFWLRTPVSSLGYWGCGILIQAWLIKVLKK